MESQLLHLTGRAMRAAWTWVLLSSAPLRPFSYCTAHQVKISTAGRYTSEGSSISGGYKNSWPDFWGSMYGPQKLQLAIVGPGYFGERPQILI
jgi:hypothetical protein